MARKARGRSRGEDREERADKDIFEAIRYAHDHLTRRPTPDGKVHAADAARIERILQQHDSAAVRTDGGDYPTPLHLAAYLLLPDIVDLLLKFGADVNAGSGSQTPLHALFYDRDIESEDDPALAGMQEMARHLLARGAQPELRDGAGRTVAELAFETLVPAFASRFPFAASRRDLGAAVKSGDVEAVREILAADPGAVRGAKWPASFLYDALALQYPGKQAEMEEIVPLLLAHGADPRAIQGGTPILFYATNPGVPPAVVRLLLEHGAEIEAKDFTERTVEQARTLDPEVARLFQLARGGELGRREDG